MAVLRFRGLEEYEYKLSHLAKDIRRIAGRVTYAGAKIIADEIKDGISTLPEKTGVTKRGLEAGFGITRLRDDDGFYNVKIGWDGYNENGVANQLMARTMESGNSKVQKHPFVRPAINRAKERAGKEMSDMLDEEIKKIMD